jgi:antitoxin component YwqK of YwqJK toxin-antitoxin module
MLRTEKEKVYSWLGCQVTVSDSNDPHNPGKCTGVYPDGKVAFSYPIVNCRFSGECRAWHENGNLQRVEHFTGGKRNGEMTEWYGDGTLKARAHYKNDSPEGLSEEWHETGVLKKKRFYSAGNLDGEAREWDERGILREEKNYRGGYLNGTARKWDSAGNLIEQATYTRGVLEGIKTEWFTCGKLAKQIKYLRGEPDGVAREWNSKGRLTAVKIYVAGRGEVAGEIADLLGAGRLRAMDILCISNVEIRRRCIEEIGYESLLDELEHSVIDRRADEELITIKWDEWEEDICLVKVKCPSTGAFYTLRVPPGMKSVEEAVAWTFGMTGEEYSPVSET